MYQELYLLYLIFAILYIKQYINHCFVFFVQTEKSTVLLNLFQKISTLD